MNSNKIDFSGEAVMVIDVVEAVHPIFKIEGMLPDYYEDYKSEYLEITATPITRTEFVLATQHYCTALLDGHMGFGLREKVGDKEPRYQDGRIIPVSFTAKNSRLFLVDKPNTEVIKIGGAAVADVFEQIDKYYYPENHPARMQKYEQQAKYELMLRLAGANIAPDDDYVELTLSCDSEIFTESVDFNPQQKQAPAKSEPDYIVRHEMIGDVFYIKLREFESDPTIDNTIAAIEEAVTNGTRNFIVDLRNNYGGNAYIGFKILEAMGVSVPNYGCIRRISELALKSKENLVEEKKDFETSTGQVIGIGDAIVYTPVPDSAKNPNNIFVSVLTDVNTYSSATMFGIWVQDGKFGNIVGEPSSNAPSAFGDTVGYVLPSGIVLHISYSRFLRPNVNADQNMLVPDISVDADNALEAALEYLQNL